MAKNLSSFLESFDSGFGPSSIIDRNGLLLRFNTDKAYFMLFQEDCFSDAVAVAIRRAKDANTKFRVDSAFLDLLPTVASVADKETMAHLRAHKDYLNEIIEEYGGDPITDDEDEMRLVAVFPSYSTGQYSDCQYTLDMRYIRDRYAEKVCDIGMKLANDRYDEMFGDEEFDDDVSYGEGFDTFSGDEVFFEDSEAGSEISFPMYLDENGNILTDLDFTKDRVRYASVKKCSIDSINIAKDSFFVMVVTDEGRRDDGGDALLQKVESKDMSLDQLNEVLIGLELAK